MSTGSPVVGIVGGGQLARMTYDAAGPLGVEVAVLAQPGDEATVGHVPRVTVVDTLDRRALHHFASGCDVVTFDHERVAAAHIVALQRLGHTVRPGALAMTMASDKASQRRHLGHLGFPVPAFAVVEGPAGVHEFGDAHGWPLVVKAARGGYDGRGVHLFDDPSDVAGLDQVAGPSSLVVEPHLDIELELSVLVARRPAGPLVTYPVVETRQDGAAICREVLAPADIDRALAHAARDLAVRISHAVDAVGILAVELFVVDGELVVNELAARPHNTGHHTIEACETSQFENHLRAVLDLPLGPTRLKAPHAAMANVLAAGDGEITEVDEPPAGTWAHLYGKTPRRGRKIGHVTAIGADARTVRHEAVSTAHRLEAQTAPPRTPAEPPSRAPLAGVTG